jgi:hypothetical protein
MSTALEVMAGRLTAVIEYGPTSEDFTLDPTGTPVSFKGVYSNSHEEDDKNEGNVTRKRRSPVIMVATIPTGAAQGVKIEYADGSAFPDGTTTKTITYIGKDDTGVQVIWLA